MMKDSTASRDAESIQRSVKKSTATLKMVGATVCIAGVVATCKHSPLLSCMSSCDCVCVCRGCNGRGFAELKQGVSKSILHDLLYTQLLCSPLRRLGTLEVIL